MTTDLNLVVMSGRLTCDCVLRDLRDGKTAVYFTLAVNKYKGADQKSIVTYVDCAAYGLIAKFLSTYFHKGDHMIITKGRVSFKVYDNPNYPYGKNKVARVVVEEVEFGVRTRTNDTVSDAQNMPPIPSDNDIPPYIPEDDLPF